MGKVIVLRAGKARGKEMLREREKSAVGMSPARGRGWHGAAGTQAEG